MQTKHPDGSNPLGFLNKYFSGYEPFVLSTGEIVRVSKCLLTLKEWKGEPTSNSYRKTVLDYKGEPLYAELAVLRMFQEEGWDGVWVDSYRRKYRIGLPEAAGSVSLPADKEKVIASIRSKTGTSGGCWDVFVWKGNTAVFLELKRRGKDRIRPSQMAWLEAALSLGLSHADFALVEWDIG